MAIETATLPAAGSKILVDRIAPDKLAQLMKLAIGSEGVLVLLSGGSGSVDAGTLRATLAADDPAVQALQGIAASGATEETLAEALESLQAIEAKAESDAPVAVALGQSDYETVAESQTDQMLGATGAVGDYLAGLLVVPASTSPGAVSIEDGSTNITVFAGGASSVSNLVPFFIPLGIASVSGGWEVTTGASVSVIAVGEFT